MDIELLRTFLVVQQTRHFARAAEQLYLTPSAVSFRIRQLEGELGAALFYRRRSNIELTAAGERLCQPAQALLDDWARTRQLINPQVGEPTRLQLAAELPLWELALSPHLGQLAQRWPAVHWQLLPPPAAPLQALAGQQLDLLLTADVVVAKKVNSCCLWQQTCLWLAPAGTDRCALLLPAGLPAVMQPPAEWRGPCWRGLGWASLLAAARRGDAALFLPQHMVSSDMPLQVLAEVELKINLCWSELHPQASLLATMARQLASDGSAVAVI